MLNRVALAMASPCTLIGSAPVQLDAAVDVAVQNMLDKAKAHDSCALARLGAPLRCSGQPSASLLTALATPTCTTCTAPCKLHATCAASQSLDSAIRGRLPGHVWLAAALDAVAKVRPGGLLARCSTGTSAAQPGVGNSGDWSGRTNSKDAGIGCSGTALCFEVDML